MTTATPRLILMGLSVAVLFGAASTARADYASTVVGDGAVGYWRLDESGATAVNSGSAGTSLDGTYQNFGPGVNQGTQQVPGLIVGDSDTAAEFNPNLNNQGTHNASANIITGGNVLGSGVFSANWTIEAWFVRDSTQQWGALFTNNTVGNEGSAPVLTFNDSSNLLGINQAGVSATNISVDLGAAHFGDVIYVALTKTGGNTINSAVFDVYVSIAGASMLHASGANYWTLTPHDGFAINNHWGAASQGIDGTIDEVAIYGSALTAAQVQAHADAGFIEAVVPEPASMGLLGLGALALVRRRR
jgi:hypothetical protein